MQKISAATLMVLPLKFVFGDPLKLVRLGEYDTRHDPDCQADQCAPPVQDRGLAKIIPHESFNEPSFHNDIAILKLDRPVELNGFVNTICLPKNDELQDQMQTRKTAVTAGWGKMNMTTAAHAYVLQFVQLPVLDGDSCYEMMGRTNLTNSIICAGAKVNQDTCTGDSGGPLMKVFDTDDGPKSFLVGVVSFGASVCGIKAPGVYTSLFFFRKWILDHIL
ncbi:CLIP domain-containing serine protease 2 [Eumeta japonica]|uniref:CLIP domain-containing serine protease 2 n=1 Tax=Eumeta variegata TaxID=151549 RepID=A0A4C1SSL6_EUMVA|nr:CLIP domain-containing serine protease 2 [Eumeta japonica]